MDTLLNKLVQENDSDHFIGKRDDESVVYCFTLHWIMILSKLIQFIIMTLLFIGILYLIIYLYEVKVLDKEVARWAILPFFLLFGFFLHKWTAKVFDIMMKLFIVTNTRIIIIDKGIFFKDNKDIIDLKKIQDIASKKTGFFPNLLRYGNIEITLSSTHSKIVIKNVPDPSKIVELVDKTKRITINKSQQTKSETIASSPDNDTSR